MTSTEKTIAARLKQVSPNNFKDDQFINQLHTWHERDMTSKGRDYLLKLLDKYKKHIPDYRELRQQHTDDQINQI